MYHPPIADLLDNIWPMFLIVAFGSFLLIEIACLVAKRKTLSETVRGWGSLWPLVPMLFYFGVGALAGHLFWNWCK